jgi:hypothetical protein
MLLGCLAWDNIVSRSLPARYPPGPWPGQMRADMAAAFLDFSNTAELAAAVKRGDALHPLRVARGANQSSQSGRVFT